MFKLKGMICLTVITVFSSGCSLESTLFGVNPSIGAAAPATQSMEVVSGSLQYVDTNTPGTYKVNVSAGDTYSKIEGVTTPGGYKVFLSVQGQIISEDQ